MTVLHLDIETYSEIDLKKVGLYRYAEDFSTELLVVCYAFDDGPVKVWLPHDDVPKGTVPEECIWQYGTECPGPIQEHIRSGGIVAAHNAQFERVILSGHVGRRHGVPALSAAQMRCTAAKASASGLPRSLGDAAAALGTHPKDDAGRTNMLGMSKPRSGKDARYGMAEYPQRWRHLISYCIDDVEAERALDRRLPDLPDYEQQVYVLDQAINDRGVKADLAAVDDAIALVAARRGEIEAACLGLTGIKPTQTGKLADWIRANGYPALPSLNAADVLVSLADPACVEPARTVLELRTIHAMKAVAKYDVMRDAASTGDRLRGMLVYWGAGTGRWSSQLVQLQNLYRPVIKDASTAIEAFAHRDLDWLRDLYAANPMKVLASCIRGMLVPADGHDLLALDYSGIENRILPWMFGEEWKLRAFEAYDRGEGPDLYKLAYARSFQTPVEQVDDFRRQIGKVMELSMGYEGGVFAFVTMSKTYKLNLQVLVDAALPVIPDDILYQAERAWAWAKESNKDQGLPRDVFITCDSLKRLWRNGHPRTVEGWADLMDAAVGAVRRPGNVFKIPTGRIAFKKHDEWLYARLPSGRKLAYYKPEVKDTERGPSLSYMGVDTKTRRWMRVGAYGGRLAENMDQAIARDIMVHGMFNVERGGYPCVLSVHDELVTEVREGFGSVDEAVALACVKPAWAEGLPLAAAGWRGKRYRK